MPRALTSRHTVRGGARVALAVVLATLGACGLPDLPPSSGACEGQLDQESFEYTLDPRESEFHLTDEALFDEDAAVNLSYGEARLQVASRWQDMPYATDTGPHELPVGAAQGDGLIEIWEVTLNEPLSNAALLSGEIDLSETSRTRLVGSFTLVYARGGDLACDFALSRDYELDVAH